VIGTTYRVVGVFDATTDDEISRDVRFWLDVLGQGTAARVVGADMILDSDDMEVLADLTTDDDGVYADGYVWVTGRAHRASELIRQRNPALRVWSLHPWLDVLVAGIVGVVANGYSRYRVVPLGTVLAVALVSAIVGFGWAACIALLRRISGTPVPGFARGFPRRFARSLLRVSWQGLVLVAVVVAVCTSGLFGWADLPAAVVLSGVVVAGLGAVRCVMIARPLVQVVLRRRGGVLR